MPQALAVEVCNHDAAIHAVSKWHYSRSMPAGKLLSFGVWEHGRFIGSVIYGRGPNRNIGEPFKLTTTEVAELNRVALNTHEFPVSMIVARSLKSLKRLNPGLRLVISYADPNHGHHGGIYQAGNWLYTGRSKRQIDYVVNGKLVHSRTVSSAYNRRLETQRHLSMLEFCQLTDPDAHIVHLETKHRYVYPLDRRTRKRLTPKALPYPSR